MNSNVTATGMSVTAQSSSSLVISNEKSVGTATTHAFSAYSTSLTPATHFNSQTVDTTTSGSVPSNQAGLIFNSNPTAVDAGTGYASSGNTLTYQYVAESDTSTYYKDYIVYIATAGETALTNQNLKVFIYTTAEVTKDTAKATSVDFYLTQTTYGADAAASVGQFIGTLNLSSLSSGTIGSTTVYRSNEIVLNGTSAISIPKNGASSADDQVLKVTMRVYFDGALQKTASPASAYITTNTADTTSASSFNAYFSAVDAG